jgi:hypothetical protein
MKWTITVVGEDGAVLFGGSTRDRDELGTVAHEV